MKITVIVKPNSLEEKVEKVSETLYKVHVKEPAKEGRANWAIERALANYFSMPASRVRIVSGKTSKTKIIEII